MYELYIHNTLSRKKELFKPINAPFVGMYVCGPTLYGDVHMGNCRTFISFDIIYRYLTAIGYKVRYVRNITDVGHLEDEVAGEGEDRVAKKARLEQLEPMEIVQRYTIGFHEVMNMFNLLPPSIEPSATGHIIEQIEMTEQIIKEGFAYEIDGNVYFNVEKFAKKNNYGILSGRSIEDQQNNTRELDGQDEKKGRLDFALWKKAKPEHIMHWNSPWGEGFPGWHIECSAMSKKYLGETFDIHGGGMDLIPTHHTNEIAQSVGCCGKSPVNYWIHTNMLTINGQKMSRSLGNTFLPVELFTGMKLAKDSPNATPSQAKLDGKHPAFEKGFSPMTVRFFMMQTHYSSTLDFSNEALIASEKGFRKLCDMKKMLMEINYDGSRIVEKDPLKEKEIRIAIDKIYAGMNDDFNTPKVISTMMNEMWKLIFAFRTKTRLVEEVDEAIFKEFKKTFNSFFSDILGLKDDFHETSGELADGLMQLIIKMRADARAKKDFATSDLVRDELGKLHIVLKDGKEGTGWELK